MPMMKVYCFKYSRNLLVIDPLSSVRLFNVLDVNLSRKGHRMFSNDLVAGGLGRAISASCSRPLR